MTKWRFIIGLFIVCSFVFLIGCKSSKSEKPVAIEGYKSEAEFIADVENKSIQFETLTARINVELNLPGKNISSRVDLKMIKDEVFQLSVQPFLGIELFRAEISVDSIKLIDRMNKRYVAENYEKLKGQTPIEFNFYNLQALFTNSLFLPGQQEISKKHYPRFRLKQTDEFAQMQAKDAMGLLYTFVVDGQEKILSTTIADNKKEYALCWSYKDFKSVDQYLFPIQMNIELLDAGTSKGGGHFSFSKVQLNAPVKIDSSIPAKYERITMNQIVKSLSNLKM